MVFFRIVWFIDTTINFLWRLTIYLTFCAYSSLFFLLEIIFLSSLQRFLQNSYIFQNYNIWSLRNFSVFFTKRNSYCGFLSYYVISLCISTYRAERGEIYFWMWGRILRNNLLSFDPARKWNGIAITVFIADELMLIKLFTFIQKVILETLDTLQKCTHENITFKFQDFFKFNLQLNLYFYN